MKTTKEYNKKLIEKAKELGISLNEYIYQLKVEAMKKLDDFKLSEFDLIKKDNEKTIQ